MILYNVTCWCVKFWDLIFDIVNKISLNTYSIFNILLTFINTSVLFPYIVKQQATQVEMLLCML